MKNVLIIGNGFDLAHGLNTSYRDFLVFCNCIKIFASLHDGDIVDCLQQDIQDMKEIMDKAELAASVSNKLKNYLKTKEIDIEEKRWFLQACCKNYWLTYVNNNKIKIKERWCDLEYLIGKQVEALSFVANNPEKMDDKQLEYHRNIDAIQEIYNKICEIEDINFHQKIKGLCNSMYDALQELIWILEIYLDKFLNDKRTPIALFQTLPISEVLSFNYTDTYQKMYKKVKNYHFIHGFANAKRKKEENNMVFGIGQDIRNSIDEDAHDYIMFQKYYQRIVKKTGNLYKEWLTHKEYMNVYIYGHSLDVPDGDVIRDFVEYEYSKVYIFYYDEKAFHSMVVNLINIFDKDIVIDLTNSKKINFIKCDEIDNDIIRNISRPKVSV